ncbi:MAG: 4-hydroxythreonine-4-phosphate dehydrogenase PdxA [Vicinamibacterales bacterium]
MIDAPGLPLIAVTVGDPSGIGPEIALKAIRDPRVVEVCRPKLYGVYEPEALSAFACGQVNAASGQAAYDAIVEATGDALASRVDAIVTAPINKAAFAAAGLTWRGHTDLLGHLCQTPDVAMMFWSERLRVVLATVHIPLSQVPTALTAEVLLKVIDLTASSLPGFGVESPRIGVAGLNPHAGEDGLLGKEEEIVMAPAIAQAREKGIAVSGPFPADTLFVRAVRGEFDVVVAAYHDQGLVPVKLLAFGRSVNVTLGLPIVRTSVDHGTAFDIARKDVADEGSLVEAILLAVKLSSARKLAAERRA